MEIIHDISAEQVSVEVENYTAYARYTLKDSTINIYSTYVPKPLEGQGIASELVRTIYNYAKEHKYSIEASCSYANAWLKRNAN